MQLTRYSDPFDHWVAVAHETLLDYRFEDEIRSDMTRMSPSWVYLHNSDGNRFIESAEHQGKAVEIHEHAAKNRSTLRHLPGYRKDFLCIVPIMGRVFRFADTGDDWRIAEERYNARAGGQVLIKRVEGASA